MVTVKTGSLEETRVNRNETGRAAGVGDRKLADTQAAPPGRRWTRAG